MPSLQDLPIELIRHIVFNLEHQRDLLHIALTCKFFHKMIILTRQLHLTKISCSDEDIPLKFWQTLYAKPHYASMIRQLEIKHMSYRSDFSNPFRGWNVDEEFAEDFASDSLLPVSVALSRQELILRNLNRMHKLKFLGICQKSHSINACDYLHHVSKNSLEALDIRDFRYYPSQYTLSVCAFQSPSPQYAYLCHQNFDFSFHFLTSFSLKTSFPFVNPIPKSHPFVMLLTSLAVDCRTLVDCSLWLFGGPLPIYDLVKKVAWPSLKRLTLVGKFQFTDAETSQEENINSYLSFLTRHSKLERLYLALLDEERRQIAGELGLTSRLLSLLPSLRSLYWCGPIHPDILRRLESIDSIPIPTDHYQLAQSLRNCVLGSIDYGELQALMEVMPRQLERFSAILDNHPPIGDPEYFESLLEELPKVLSPLINLTHLEISFGRCDERMSCSPRVFIGYLPSLAYFRFTTAAYNPIPSEWKHVTVDNSSSPYTYRFETLYMVKGDCSYESIYWGDFFMAGTEL